MLGAELRFSQLRNTLIALRGVHPGENLVSQNLLDLSARELLEAFGAGNPTPGSGSAAALQGLIASQLLRTVLTITLRNNDYAHVHDELEPLRSEIEADIEPLLANLFEEDSVFFAAARRARQAWKNAKTEPQQDQIRLRDTYLAEARECTESPMEMARQCLRLCEIGKIVVDRASKFVRGDSNAALNAAIAGAGGAISIVELNLRDFPNDEWAEGVRIDVDTMRRDWLAASASASKRVASLREEETQKADVALQDAIAGLTQRAGEDSGHAIKSIERIAGDLQRLLWAHRGRVWSEEIPMSKVDVLDPEMALNLIGFAVEHPAGLPGSGIPGDRVETAALIDPESRTVKVSQQFRDPLVRRFTTAHELGHALLHPGLPLHRDRGLDGSSLPAGEDRIERQASQFATFFLMPAGRVQAEFRGRFGVESFRLDGVSPLDADPVVLRTIQRFGRHKRELSTHLATVMAFETTHIDFDPLHVRFGVSKTAMAIRLEELALV